MLKHMYLTLPSNTTDFADNITSSFRVRLPNPVELEGEWEMALVELQYPYSWNNIRGDTPDEDNVILFELYSFPNSEDNYHVDLVPVNVPPGSYTTTDELVKVIQKAVKKFTFDGERYNLPATVTEDKEDPFLSRIFKIKYKPLEKRVMVKLDYRYTRGVVLGSHIQYMLGFDSERSTTLAHSHNLAKYPPDLTAGFSSLYVYCDLVQPQIVGGTLVPLLRTVPIEGKFGDNINKVFLDPHYLPLRSRTFDSIDIAIKDDSNNFVGFNFGKAIVKVHLRQRNRNL